MAENTDAQVYELEKVKFIIKDALQLDISYAYDDLVFSEHALVIIQFDKNDVNKLYCWFNTGTTEEFRVAAFESLGITCKLNRVKLENKGLFDINQKENGEELDIKFLPNP